jgi:hypothetical protein
MSTNDDDGVYKVQTVPPPSGGDAYSAPTKVGPMTTALVEEMMHAAKQKADLKKQSAAATARHPRYADPPASQAVAPIVRVRRPPPIDRNEPPEIQPPSAPIPPLVGIAPAPPPPTPPPPAQPASAPPALAWPPLVAPAASLAPVAPLAPPEALAPAPQPVVWTAPFAAPVARATPRGRLVVLRVVFAAAAVTIIACGLGLAMYIAVARGWHLR